MGRGLCWKLWTRIVLLMVWISPSYIGPAFAEELEVDQLIDRLRSQILAAEKRAQENPLFGIKEVKLHISYTIEKKGEGGFKAYVITASASVSAHAVQTMELTLSPLQELRVETPSEEPPVTGRASVPLNFFFEPGSAKILPNYYSDLDKLGRVLTAPQYRDYHISIEGHTDNRESKRDKQQLSQKRAESVKQYLVNHFCIDPRRLKVKGYGSSRPIAANDTPEGRDKNRRVEIVNVGKE